MSAAEIAMEAPGPAIAVDRDNRILAINRAARDLFGFSPRTSLLDRSLFELIRGRDVFGNRLADRADGLWQMISLREPVHSFEISAHKTTGEALRLAVHVVVVVGPGDDDRELVYLLTPVLRRRKADEAIDRILAERAEKGGASALRPIDPRSAQNAPVTLTPRQSEVLRLLANGANVDEIAGALGISIYTVRTHIQRILEALDVHSQVEAVARAFRDRLI
jgi:DNA-binding NarL/FixJ family response regulator